jgi:hypothetical protein
MLKMLYIDEEKEKVTGRYFNVKSSLHGFEYINYFNVINIKYRTIRIH